MSDYATMIITPYFADGEKYPSLIGVRVDGDEYETAYVKKSEMADVGTCRNIDDDPLYFCCSKCGSTCTVEYGDGGYGSPMFCPSCGRKVER